ncbi:MAG: hypothetical protein BIFFINMI_01112 [Phycisphaerae bacterium]|nr:hypothetical protein [Phycisphaerae bacterium]
MAKSRKKSEDVGMNMTPMIDVVFQLILFFLLVSQFASAETDPKILLPELDWNTSVTAPAPAEFKLLVNMMAKEDSTDKRELDYVKVGPINVTRMAALESKNPDELITTMIREQDAKVREKGGTLKIILRCHKTLAWKHVRNMMVTLATMKIRDIYLAGPMGKYGEKLKQQSH